MSANELLGRLADLDVRLSVDGDRLRYDAPRGVLTAEVLAAMREHKATLLSLLAGTGPSETVANGAGPVFLDLETRSRADLRGVGGRRYAGDPSTAIISCVALVDGRAVVWCPRADAPPAVTWPAGHDPLPFEAFVGPDLPAPLAGAVRAGRPFVAHNARGFDQPVWAGQGLPAPARWVDTMPLARAAGLPGALDGIVSWLFDVGKDPAGKRLIARYGRPYGKAKKFREPAGEDLAALVRYNLADVLLLAKAYPELVKYDAEPELLAVDSAINGRGIHLDRDLARAALALEADDTAHLAHLAEEASGGAVKPADLTRTPFLGEWLESRGIGLGRTPKGKVQLTKAVVADLLRRKELPPGVREVLTARKAVGRTTTGKLRKALHAVDPDGRLRHQLVYHKAHPGRWAGREVQPQNLPKPHPALGDLTPLVEAAGDPAAFRAALPEGVSFADGLSALVRPSFVAAPGKALLIADYASVEARGVAWLAGEEDLLAAFREGRDVYRELAGMIFGKPADEVDKAERAVGKQAVLGAGYGMGPVKFAATCEANGVDLAAAGVTAEQVVDAFRDAYPRIAGTRRADGFGRAGGLWKEVEAAALAAVRDGRAGRAGRCAFAREGNTLVITLPSGRRLSYRHARVEPRAPGYGGGVKPTLVFDCPEESGEKKRKGAKPGKGGYGLEEATYGGKLTENITQAVCRDLLAGALVACERAGLPVVLHSHDEIVCEVDADHAEEDLRRLAEIMSAVPGWAAGFPVAVEGYATARYSKLPPEGAPLVEAKDGKVTKSTAGAVAGFAPKAFAPPESPPPPPAPAPADAPVSPPGLPKPLRELPPAHRNLVGSLLISLARLEGGLLAEKARLGREAAAPAPDAGGGYAPVWRYVPPRSWPAPIPLHADFAPSPARWYGGKGDKKAHTGRQILAMGGPHRVYVEPFLGGASVLLAKPRCEVEVANDLDADMIAFWAALRDDAGAVLALLPSVPKVPGYPLKKKWEGEGKNKKEVFNPANAAAMALADAFTADWLGRAKEAMAREGLPPVERVAWRFLANRLSFGGEGGSPLRGTRVRGGLPEALNSYATALDNLSAAGTRLRGVTILNRPAPEIIREYDAPDALIYCDPPFVHDTRTSADNYAHEMTDAQHEELIAVLDACEGRVLLEGYPSALYGRLLDPARWQRYEKVDKVSVGTGVKKNDRIHCVWVKKGANE